MTAAFLAAERYWDVHDTPYEASLDATFQLCGNLTPRQCFQPRSSDRAGGTCSGGPKMPRSWTAVRPAGTGNRRPSSALGCHRQSIAAVALSQAGRIPRGPLPFQLFPAEPQRPFLGPRGRGRELPEPFCVPLKTGLRASRFPCPQFTPRTSIQWPVEIKLQHYRLVCIFDRAPVRM